MRSACDFLFCFENSMLTAQRRITDPPLVTVDEPAGSPIRLEAMEMKLGLRVAGQLTPSCCLLPMFIRIGAGEPAAGRF